MRVSIVAGTRPNFIKIAPIVAAIREASQQGANIGYRLIHTGQHYDDLLSGVFFKQLGIPNPDANLGCGSGTQAIQTAGIMVEFEKELLRNPCDMVIVVGDVNSTMACTIVAKKLNIKVAHVEGGIRSFDMTMPEEINRLVTDAIADYFFTTSQVANQNLMHSGIQSERIFFVGNTMIDTLLGNVSKLKRPAVFDTFGLAYSGYFVLTFHRPSNVDDPKKLKHILDLLLHEINVPVVFPVHPRTQKIVTELAYAKNNLHLIQPLSYLEFIYMIKHAKAVITDSGGIQEETTVLGVPCITMRNNTERPETITIGTNELVGDDETKLKKCIQLIFNNQWKKGAIPEYWDGKTAQRIVQALVNMQ